MQESSGMVLFVVSPRCRLSPAAAAFWRGVVASYQARADYLGSQ